MPERRAVGTGWAAGAFTEAAEGEARPEAATAEGSAAAGSAKERMSAQVASDNQTGEGSTRAPSPHDIRTTSYDKVSQRGGKQSRRFVLFPRRTWRAVSETRSPYVCGV
jgi:hypothetical protein